MTAPSFKFDSAARASRAMFIALAATFAGLAPAHAQISLPWMRPPAPVPTAPAPSAPMPVGPVTSVPVDPAAAKPKPKPKPKPEAGPVRAPGEEAVIDRSLLLNGVGGRLELERRDKTLTLVKLTLAGEEPGKPGSSCRVEAAPAPIAATPAGKPNGLLRYEVDAPNCKFAFEVMDGAVLVESAMRPCEFATPACRVDVNGVWGPPSTSLVGDRVKDIERVRSHAETAMRANFKTLVGRTSGNDAVKLVAREQAGFTSHREMICRDYQGETKHGFCASRVTEARALALSAKLAGPQTAEAGEPKKAKKKKPKPKPAQAAAPVVAPQM